MVNVGVFLAQVTVMVGTLQILVVAGDSNRVNSEFGSLDDKSKKQKDMGQEETFSIRLYKHQELYGSRPTPYRQKRQHVGSRPTNNWLHRVRWTLKKGKKLFQFYQPEFQFLLCLAQYFQFASIFGFELLEDEIVTELEEQIHEREEAEKEESEKKSSNSEGFVVRNTPLTRGKNLTQNNTSRSESNTRGTHTEQLKWHTSKYTWLKTPYNHKIYVQGREFNENPLDSLKMGMKSFRKAWVLLLANEFVVCVQNYFAFRFWYWVDQYPDE